MTKRVMAMMARVMVTATERAMVTDGNTTDNGHGKEGDGHLMVAMMGTAQKTRLLTLGLERGGDGGNEPSWFVCVFWYVWRDHKK